MRRRVGRSEGSLVERIPSTADASVRALVKRPSRKSFERTKRMSPSERLDRAFALMELADARG